MISIKLLLMIAENTNFASHVSRYSPDIFLQAIFQTLVTEDKALQMYTYKLLNRMCKKTETIQKLVYLVDIENVLDILE